MLRPLLQKLDDEYAEHDAQHLRMMKPKLNLEQLPLTLLLLRTVWPGLPVAMVGYGMVRRSLSIVAVDAHKVCKLAVTHEIQWATPATNAADVTQQARLSMLECMCGTACLTCCCTFRSFCDCPRRCPPSTRRTASSASRC
jgi:hypothetical protein